MLKLRSLVFSAAAVMAAASCLDAQPGRRSQLATVSQLMGDAKIDIVYRRPVARGRELFGSLVPWSRVWTPSADSAALFTTSADLEINGSALRAGSYAIWMIPERETWTVIFTSKPAFHLALPARSDEVLRVTARSQQGDHMETLGFYFPMADADSAILNMHWGKTVVPITIKAGK
jgi:hypothetical protein